MSDQAEQERINQVYRQWHGGAALAKYAWHRPDIVRQTAARARVLADLLPLTVGRDLSAVRALDVGCGSGGFLRQLIDWGATPSHLAGTELQPDRLEQARSRTAPGVRWHLGQLDVFPDASMDLVSAHTVFSALLDEDLRRGLAAEMWRVLRPGGWTMIFDCRYDSARNTHVRKVTDVELLRFWPAASRHYRTLVLAPPVGRTLAALPWLIPEALATLLPPLRSHFIYMARKPATDRMNQ
ncbi:class I SAM-dependent methyltransferase [Massilia kyonggiensis]|nr:class I SAM-dependent methyltransferase [Massilia kyonggiensis]